MTASLALAPRSLLFVPADRAQEVLPKAIRSGADGVILDLEDGVAPSAKGRARDALVSALSAGQPPLPVLVRVNPRGTPWHVDDLRAAAAAQVAGVMLPKCGGADDVAGAMSSIAHQLPMLALIETPAGVLAAPEIAHHRRVIGLAFGAEDFGVTAGTFGRASGRQLDHARLHITLAAAAASVWSLDAPSLELTRMDVIRRQARTAARHGFDGKLVVHPAQVGPVHDAFRPRPGEVARARRILEKFDEMERRGVSVGRMNGRMVDAPVVAAARRLLERAASVTPATEEE